MSTLKACRCSWAPLHLQAPLVVSLDLGVQEHTKQGDTRADGVLCGQRVVERDHARHNHHHALDAVADAVRDRGNAGQDHVG